MDLISLVLPKITCSNDAREVFVKVWDDNKIEFVEEFKVMLLNRANRVIGIVSISAGGISGSSIFRIPSFRATSE